MADTISPSAHGTGGVSDGGGPDSEEETHADDACLFGRYRVLRELGRGGMGVVLLAHDEELGQPVAVKIIPDLLVRDAEGIAGLKKEVLRGMALLHPGIVRTHTFERDAAGAAIIMEYVEGENLQQLRAAQPQGCYDPAQILPWIEQLCAVLDYAHFEARIAHRDLKPRNIMIARSGKLKVADFGLSAVLGDSMSRHSAEGMISGTLAYMSPQQAEGKRPTHLDDIHALGATLYELLTGRPPFFRGNPASIHTQILQVAPPRMSARREELEVAGRAPIPSAWEETIAACLSKDPRLRPQSAGEVLARLKATSEREAPLTEAVSRNRANVGRRKGRHPVSAPLPRARLICGALAIVALVAGGAYWVSTTLPHSSRLAASSSARLLAAASKGAPFENSLGMKFVPVPITGGPTDGQRVLFSIWETRVQDYAPFARERREWPKPGFEQGPTHPAVMVTWSDAQAFCEWLTQHERKAGRLSEAERYRLPSDHEWSCAIGIGPQEDARKAPKDKSSNLAGIYPWGTAWPPPPGSGNYADEAAGREGVSFIAGYRDGFSKTSSVGYFAENDFGLHDLGGNVWELCGEVLSGHPGSRVIRGGSWFHGGRTFLLSSNRFYTDGHRRNDGYGFRVVLAPAR